MQGPDTHSQGTEARRQHCGGQKATGSVTWRGGRYSGINRPRRAPGARLLASGAVTTGDWEPLPAGPSRGPSAGCTGAAGEVGHVPSPLWLNCQRLSLRQTKTQTKPPSLASMVALSSLRPVPRPQGRAPTPAHPALGQGILTASVSMETPSGGTGLRGRGQGQREIQAGSGLLKAHPCLLEPCSRPPPQAHPCGRRLATTRDLGT